LLGLAAGSGAGWEAALSQLATLCPRLESVSFPYVRSVGPRMLWPLHFRNLTSLEQVECTAPDLEAILAACPHLSILDLTGLQPDSSHFDALRQSGGAVRDLKVSQCHEPAMNDGSLLGFIASSSLTALDVWGSCVTAASLVGFARLCPTLVDLSFGAGAGAESVAECSATVEVLCSLLPHMRRLAMSNCDHASVVVLRSLLTHCSHTLEELDVQYAV
jgi:hypothetical protein